MSRYRYRVDGLPPGKVGAFMPIPTIGHADYGFGDLDVYGAPGTIGVPAPVTDVRSNTNRTGVDSGRGSDGSPNVVLPVVYIAGTRNCGPEHGAPGIGMSRRRRCELPVPAVGFTRLAKMLPLIVTKGSRTTQPWPRAMQRYPTQGG